MRRRDTLALIGSVAVFPAGAFGQQSNKEPRIGWIILGSPAGAHPDIFSYYDSFRAGLHDLGYVEGVNLTISAKDAQGVPERLPKLIDELVVENVSIILSPGPAIKVVREKVQSIPVVFAFSGDPVVAGLVDTLARGRGNLTGLTYMAVQLNEKRLDLLKELLPSYLESHC
jgi:putative tryptophan/tyrosine transport system substrate-binding protein